MKYSWEVKAEEMKLKLCGVVRKLKHYRCGCCRARTRLNRELWQYIKPPKCKECRSLDWRLDLHRTKEHLNRTGIYDSCHCDALWHPHRSGSIPTCRASTKKL